MRPHEEALRDKCLYKSNQYGFKSGASSSFLLVELHHDLVTALGARKLIVYLQISVKPLMGSIICDITAN